MENTNELPKLTLEEIRVLGALIEKSKTTPDYYPLTLNSLITACNQKSSRNPVVEFQQNTVLETIDSLKKKMLLANVLGDGRTIKYRHTIAVKYALDPAEVTVLGLLFLRGPITLGEIKNMAGRMYDFEDLHEVQTVVTNLMNEDFPYLAQMERRPGQKEARFYHLFADQPEFEEESSKVNSSEKINDLENRIVVLEEQVATMKKILDDLMN